MASSIIATVLLFSAILLQFTDVLSATCPGCAFDAEPSQAEIDDLNTVVEMQDTDIEVVKITSMKKQKVSGMKYMVEFEAKSKTTNEQKLCKALYLSRPWEEKRLKVVKFNCE